jgi:hypothetical protein
MNWSAETDTLRIYSTHKSNPLSKSDQLITDTLILAKNQINEVLIEEFSVIRLLFCLGIVVGIVILIKNYKSDPPVLKNRSLTKIWSR